jgi:hypothetical protein
MSFKPHFCVRCGDQVIRLQWYPWTSRRFCPDCNRGPRRSFTVARLLWPLVIFLVGVGLGRSARPAPPPLIVNLDGLEQIELPHVAGADQRDSGTHPPGPTDTPAVNAGAPDAGPGDVYLCGAQTKKGTPCTRRVHGNVRCWQHKGQPAQLSREKLKVKE